MEQDDHHPHDTFFRDAFSQLQIVRSFVETYLPPELVALLDLDSLTLEKDSFIDEKHRSSQADVVYKLSWRKGLKWKGIALYLYLLFEHKSSPWAEVAYQLLKYEVQLWERDRPEKGWHQKKRPLPIILPIVFYHGTRKWSIAPNLAALFGDIPQEFRPYLPDFHYILEDFSYRSEMEIKGDPLLELTLLAFRSVYDPSVKAWWPIYLEKYMEESERTVALEFLERMLAYLLTTVEKLDEALVRNGFSAYRPKGERMMTTLVQKWKLEGKLEGLLEGKLEGKLEGLLEGKLEGEQKTAWHMILRRYVRKFGTAPEQVVDFIQSITDLEKFDELDDLLIMAETAEELDSLWQLS